MNEDDKEQLERIRTSLDSGIDRLQFGNFTSSKFDFLLSKLDEQSVEIERLKKENQLLFNKLVGPAVKAVDVALQPKPDNSEVKPND